MMTLFISSQMNALQRFLTTFLHEKELQKSLKEEQNQTCKYFPRTQSLNPISSSASQISTRFLTQSNPDQLQAQPDSPNTTRHFRTKMIAIKFSLTNLSWIPQRCSKMQRLKFSTKSEVSRRELSNIKTPSKKSKKPSKNPIYEKFKQKHIKLRRNQQTSVEKQELKSNLIKPSTRSDLPKKAINLPINYMI